jgi:hypothetical protein
MSDWQKILKLEQRSLTVLVLSLVCALGIYGTSHFFKVQQQFDLEKTQQMEASERASLVAQQTDLSHLTTEISRFKLLREQGMLGAGDRQRWVAEWVASQQRTGQPNTMTYTLQLAQPLATQETTASAPPLPAESGATATAGPLFYDLDFELVKSHEEELLALLQDFQVHVKGRFRINACALSARTEVGLTARCKLRFFTSPDVSVKGSS